MFSIFSSSNKLVIQSSADPQIILQKFRERIKEDTIGTRFAHAFTLSDAYFGKVDGRNVTVRYDHHVKNSLEPFMHIHVENSTDGGSLQGNNLTYDNEV